MRAAHETVIRVLGRKSSARSVAAGAFQVSGAGVNIFSMRTPTKKSKSAGASYLGGQLLIAMPTMTDKRFHRSVIYMCTHSSDGAMGIIINQRAPSISFAELLGQLKIKKEIGFQPEFAQAPVHVGGPVSTERGFVLHSNDFVLNEATMTIANGICLTATIEILKAMATGKGPRQSILALGYSGWAPGQLETEIQANGWLHCQADRELVFGSDLDLKYDRALSKLGIDLSHLVSEAGHA